MEKVLLSAGAALALLFSGTARAESWPGFFRPAAAQGNAVQDWPGFYRAAFPAAITVTAVLDSPIEEPTAAAASLFPQALQQRARASAADNREEESEVATVAMTHSGEISSALGATAGRLGGLRVSAGYYDILQDDNTAASFSLEYHAGRLFWWLEPFAGLMATTEGAAYAYAGLALDIVIADRIGITPSAAVGAYHEGGGKDLGHWVQFRTGGELSYIFNNGQRLGAAFHHISNAGLDRRNPGTEILELSYRTPLGALFSN